MIEIRFIRITGMCLLLTAPCWGQVSTFPSPPALPSQQPDRQSTDSTSERLDPSSTLTPDNPAQTPGSNNTPSTSPPTTQAPSIPITAATLSSMAALDDKIPLEAGDSISFRVIEDRDEAVPRVVTDTGEVDFPYIGRVKVEGKTCHAVAVEVKKLLEVDYYKQATVIVGLDLIIGQDKTKAKDMAWVVGEVRQVGPLELLKAQPMTVSQIILRAGGFSDFADQRKVKMIHRSSKASDSGDAKPVDLNNVNDAQIIDVKSVFDGKSAVDPVVKPGDYIIVPKRLFNY